MHLETLLTSHTWRQVLLAVSALFAFSGLSIAARAQSATVFPSQVPAARSPIAQSPAIPAGMDPTKPEAQPPLDVDRDPIASPDPEVRATVSAPPPVTANVPGAANASNVPSSSNQSSAIEKQQNGTYVLRANVDEVLLNCAVIDAKGQTVTDLSRGDFRVWEDGISETINSVQHLDLPVSMGILIDNSGSMRDKRGAVNSAAFQLLRASNPQDEAFVVNFSDQAYLDQRLTTDRVALEHGISRFDSQGTTAVYDAVAAAADELSKHGKNRKEVLLIITDGADNASRLNLEEAIRRVQGMGGPVVYTIGLLFDTPRQELQQARNALEMLSQETGGIAYFPSSLQDVNDIAAQVARDIREQYVVDYHSSKPFTLGGYRTLRVEATSPRRGPLVVRTKRGYFAQPQPASHVQQANEQ